MKDPYLSRRIARLRKSFARRMGPLLANMLKNTAFFLQSQMDINPKSIWHRKDFIDATGGYQVSRDETRVVGQLMPFDVVRRDALILLLRSVIERKVPGDFIELGVWKGRTAKLIHHYARERTLHLFDTFTGFNEHDVRIEKDITNRQEKVSFFSDTTVEDVLAFINSNNDNIRVYAGYFPESFPDKLHNQKFSFIHLDVDLYNPVKAGLECLFDKLSRGGVMVVHDYNAWQGVRTAVDEFFADRVETPIPLPDKCGSVVILKI